MRPFSFIRRMSLTQRLLALTLAASLPGLFALVYSSIDLRNTRYGEVRAEALRNVHFVVSEIDQIFDGVEGVLHAVSQASEVHAGDNASCTDYITRVRAQLPQLTSIIIAGTDGALRCYSEGRQPQVNLADRFYFREAIATRAFSIGNYTTSRVSDRNIVPMALPVIENGEVAYVMVAGLNIDWFGQQIRDRGLARGSTITVADRNGIIIAREPDPEKYVGTMIATRYVKFLSERADTREVEGRDGIARILAFVPAPETPFGLYVSSGISREESFGPIDRALRNSLLLFGLGACAAFFLTWMVGEGIIRRPLMLMVATAEAWRRGYDSARTGITNRSDEIGILGQTIDRLMDENARREEERELSESRREILVHELAHRVKNTLATVQSIASLSFRDSQGPEALRGFQERLQALVRSHDLLTRRNWEHADLLEVAEAALAPAREDGAHRITLKGPRVDLTSATVVPMAMILHELCTNAMKYGALATEHGKITVEWTASQEPRGTLIDLLWSESEGPPVEPPTHEGFGSKLIASLTQQMNGGYEINYPRSGIICRIRLIAPCAQPREDDGTA